jgi:hypothetical protein
MTGVVLSVCPQARYPGPHKMHRAPDTLRAIRAAQEQGTVPAAGHPAPLLQQH